MKIETHNGRTPDLAALINAAINYKLGAIETASEGRVKTVNSDGTVDVLPLDRLSPDSSDATQEYKSRPLVNNVPVAWPQINTGTYVAVLRGTLKPEMDGILLYGKHPHDEWFLEGEEYDSLPAESFGYNGALFVPGLNSSKRALPVQIGEGIELLLSDTTKGISSRIGIDAATGNIKIVPGGTAFIDLGAETGLKKLVTEDIIKAISNILLFTGTVKADLVSGVVTFNNQAAFVTAANAATTTKTKAV